MHNQTQTALYLMNENVLTSIGTGLRILRCQQTKTSQAVGLYMWLTFVECRVVPAKNTDCIDCIVTQPNSAHHLAADESA